MKLVDNIKTEEKPKENTENETPEETKKEPEMANAV